jgi:hypothetical protein
MRSMHSIITKLAGVALLGALPLLSWASPLQVTIRPIQVCDDSGLTCANPTLNLFSAETSKIWAQADIAINFLGWQTVNSSARLNEDNFSDLGNLSPSNVVDLWFVNDLTDCGGPVSGTLFGCGTSGGWFALTKAVFDYSPVGRLDTLAHELGHVLGLGHGDFGAGGGDNLMTAGSSRLIPQLLSDINPDGAGLDKLTAAQIAEARTSSYLTAVPEPGSLALAGLATALLMLSAASRGRARAH